jgi:hypothetical protein
LKNFLTRLTTEGSSSIMSTVMVAPVSPIGSNRAQPSLSVCRETRQSFKSDASSTADV